MSKIIFELSDVRISPRSEPKLSIEIKYEPLKQNGRAKELADRIIDCIDDYRAEKNGTAKIKSADKY